MMNINYAYIAGTILFTVYGQLVIKWQIGEAGALPADMLAKVGFLVRLLFTPWILSGFAAAFLAALCWMAAMTRFDLSHAYPFMSLAFALILVSSAVLFQEPLTWPKVLGLLMIMVGIVISSRG
jgi:multidrug transporter EmrE-like cation transporter